MPTYEYQCDICGARFEKFQRMSDEPVRECSECGRTAARRLISTGGGIVFRGSGFYVTDYRDPAYAKAKSADTNLASTTTVETKPDSKPKTPPATESKPADANPSTGSKKSWAGTAKEG